MSPLIENPARGTPDAHQQVDLALILGLDLGSQRLDAVRAAGLELEQFHPGPRGGGVRQRLSGLRAWGEDGARPTWWEGGARCWWLA
jgi:hypothetical protein